MTTLLVISPWCFLKRLHALKVLEPRFNVEALALLLNIPPNKTLLRRHLATHFHLLVGSEAQRLKQDCLENPDYTVLTATAKVKVTARPLQRKQTSLCHRGDIRSSFTHYLRQKLLFCPPAASVQDIFHLACCRTLPYVLPLPLGVKQGALVSF